METEKTKRIFLRPADQSLEAYKEWIAAMYTALTGKESGSSKRSEDEWGESHKNFCSTKGTDR